MGEKGLFWIGKINNRKSDGGLEFYKNKILCIRHVKKLIILFVKKSLSSHMQKHHRFSY